MINSDNYLDFMQQQIRSRYKIKGPIKTMMNLYRITFQIKKKKRKKKNMKFNLYQYLLMGILKDMRLSRRFNVITVEKK